MSYFVFQWPWMLLLLVGLVPLYLLERRSSVEKEAVRSALGAGPVAGLAISARLRGLAMVCLVLALARPGYAPVRQSVSTAGRDVVFVLDVSRSMLAEDVHPSRLESAKQGIRDCLASLDSERAGLVVYAGSSNIACPLTRDSKFVRFMVDQAQPRSVDFGGSFLQSAVEKAVDQVFSDERRGFQDMIVLTDGGDHGPGMDKVADLLNQHGVELLVVGLGDTDVAARIPVLDDEGKAAYLEHEGEVVRTKLEDESLRQLCGLVRGGQYFGAGTSPFHLGDVYRGFSEGKATEGRIGDDDFVVYREGAYWLMPIGLILLLLPEWRGRSALAGGMTALLLATPQVRGDETVPGEFSEAVRLMGLGRPGEAVPILGELAAQDGLTPRQLGVLAFNRALALTLQLEKDAGLPARQRLEMARQVQGDFLDAVRLDPGLQRAAMRLDEVAALVAGIEAEVAEEERQDQEIQEALAALIERLEKLLEGQQNLLADTRTQGPPARGRGNAAAAPVPADAGDRARQASLRQKNLRIEAESISDELKELETQLAVPGTPGVLEQPVKLMSQAVNAQLTVEDGLRAWEAWPATQPLQRRCIELIEEVLSLLANSSSDESEDGEYEDEGDYEDWDESAEGEGDPSSMAMDGDFSAGNSTQPLPLPNLSAEEILKEEIGNQQFRQQQRAKANAGEVERDW